MNHELVNRILNKLDYHPLSITLVAKTAQSSRLSIEELYERVLKSGLNISDIPLNGYKKLTIMDVLTEEFDISELETYQQMLIKQFAVLPSEFISFIQLKDLLSITSAEYDRFIQALNALEHKGWLLHNDTEDSFKAHFVVQEVIRHRLPPSLNDCKRLIDSIKKHLEDEHDAQRYKCLYYAESILEHLNDGDLADLEKLVAVVNEELRIRN